MRLNVVNCWEKNKNPNKQIIILIIYIRPGHWIGVCCESITGKTAYSHRYITNDSQSFGGLAIGF